LAPHFLAKKSLRWSQPAKLAFGCPAMLLFRIMHAYIQKCEKQREKQCIFLYSRVWHKLFQRSTGVVYEFLSSAFPWIAIGMALAIFSALWSEKSSEADQKKKAR